MGAKNPHLVDRLQELDITVFPEMSALVADSRAPFEHIPVTALGLGDKYFVGLADDMVTKRDVLCVGLHLAGLKVFHPAGTYYVTVDITPLGIDSGIVFCRALPKKCGVVAVLNKVLYDDKDTGHPLVRFACCRRPKVLVEAVTRISVLGEVI